MSNTPTSEKHAKFVEKTIDPAVKEELRFAKLSQLLKDSIPMVFVERMRAIVRHERAVAKERSKNLAEGDDFISQTTTLLEKALKHTGKLARTETPTDAMDQIKDHIQAAVKLALDPLHATQVKADKLKETLVKNIICALHDKKSSDPALTVGEIIEELTTIAMTDFGRYPELTYSNHHGLKAGIEEGCADNRFPFAAKVITEALDELLLSGVTPLSYADSLELAEKLQKLKENEAITIGRSKTDENGYQVPSLYSDISRRHARIHLLNRDNGLNLYEVEDLRSLKGLVIIRKNGEMVPVSVRVNNMMPWYNTKATAESGEMVILAPDANSAPFCFTLP